MAYSMELPQGLASSPHLLGARAGFTERALWGLS